MRESYAHANKKDAKQPVHYWPVITLWLSWPDTVNVSLLKIVSEYDQEIPQSQTADNPVASRGRVAQPSRDTRKTN